jgi:hypothetical protein
MDQLEEKGKGFLAARARSGSTEFAEKILRLLRDHGAVSSEICLFLSSISKIGLKVLYLIWSLEFGVVRFWFWGFRGSRLKAVFARWFTQTENLKH